jgi:hypothetical protein
MPSALWPALALALPLLDSLPRMAFDIQQMPVTSCSANPQKGQPCGFWMQGCNSVSKAEEVGGKWGRQRNSQYVVRQALGFMLWARMANLARDRAEGWSSREAQYMLACSLVQNSPFTSHPCLVALCMGRPSLSLNDCTCYSWLTSALIPRSTL